jgi:hypothetical protein
MKELEKEKNKSASENGTLGFILISLIMMLFFAGAVYLTTNAFGN